MGRPYVVLSVAASIDGRIDDAGPDRLLLSDHADFDRVDQLRADSDAILVGAEAVRRDDPALTVKNVTRQQHRTQAGRPPQPLRVTVTRSGNLDADRRLWQGEGRALVYTVDDVAQALGERLAGLAEVVALGAQLDFAAVLDDLGLRGIGQLMVEGGAAVLSALLAADLADELQLAVAPLLVGQADAPPLLRPARYPGGRMRLATVTRVGDLALLRYLPKERTHG